MLTHRNSLLGTLLLTALGTGWLAFQSARADDDEKKEPPKKADASEEKNLKEALDHLRQFRELAQKLKEAESRAKCAENLRQLGIAVHNFQDSGGKLPAAPPAHWQSYPSLQELTQPTWYSQILPFIEQGNLYAPYGSGRLGATTEPLSPALAKQLGLEDRGQLITDVPRDSPAAKAGLKQHDVLVELAGKPVPHSAEEFMKTLHAMKADAVVSAVVVRKGEKVAIKDLKLAATDSLWQYQYLAPLRFQNIKDGTSNTIIIGERYARPDLWGHINDAPAAISPVTTHRKDDRFTARYQEGSLIITVTGTAKDGKHALGRVKVQDGGVEKVYESLDKVPPEYRDKASDVIAAAEKGEGRIDIKK